MRFGLSHQPDLPRSPQRSIPRGFIQAYAGYCGTTYSALKTTAPTRSQITPRLKGRSGTSSFDVYLIDESFTMSQFITSITIPKSVKTPAFRFTAAGLLLFIAATDPMHFSGDRNNPPKKLSNFYSVGIFIVWVLASFTTLASCEWHIQRVLFVRHVRERILRQKSDHDSKIPPVEEDHPVSFDTVMLAPYSYSMIATFDSIIRTAMGDQSEQRDIATTVAYASSLMACYALIGTFLCRRDERYGITVHPTNLRLGAWAVLFVVSALANALGRFTRRKM
jgi:hypothetical protein